jgi:hypothetical protein
MDPGILNKFLLLKLKKVKEKKETSMEIEIKKLSYDRHDRDKHRCAHTHTDAHTVKGIFVDLCSQQLYKSQEMEAI